ncbi:MAG: ATP-dependent DNA helicase RecG [Nitrospirales bacterium]|nr:ATP-dependent DNA helicase RecG [Nitrospirales bacterium]
METHLHNHEAPDRGTRQQPPSELPIRFAKGVGPKRAKLFEKLGILTIEDALWHIPWRYEDRSTILPIRHLTAGTCGTISGTIHSSTLLQTRRLGMTMLKVIVQDETGSLEVIFFNQPYLKTMLTLGAGVIMSGMVAQASRGRTGLQLRSPSFEVVEHGQDRSLHVGRLVPIYHETRGLTSRHIRRIANELLAQSPPVLEDVLPPSIRARYHFPALPEAVGHLHFPPQHWDLTALNQGTTLAHRRLSFEECFLFQLALGIRRHTHREDKPGIAFSIPTTMLSTLHSLFPFQLTAAQERVIKDIQDDMVRPHPMNRLIQGDVGSGKTLVALSAMIIACGSGYQAALMAPTEILAEQHALTMNQPLAQLGLRALVLKGSMSAKDRREALASIQSGKTQIIIGTHALLQQQVEFFKLGLVVVDEQHKFGVLQRATLQSKSQHPDTLVMTATPIPRTLAMTAYGDLDVSVIDSLPPGRQPIQTQLYRKSGRKQAYALVHDQIQAGHQAYVVYPLVDESEHVDLESAIQAADRLQTKEFPTHQVGLLHGRMKSAEKFSLMEAFRQGAIHILVSTTIVEVGLDVPNATVMLIEHAERFGLAQLHQLRGRVGRGTVPSLCLLISDSVKGAQSKPIQQDMLPLSYPHSPGLEIRPTPLQSAQQRLQAMVDYSDGFAIAEKDLQIRGPGEFLGVRQWGLPTFRVTDLLRDRAILEHARTEALALIERDPHLLHPDHRALKTAMFRRWGSAFNLGSVG